MTDPETPTNERPEHAANCPGWGAWDIPGACNCGGKYREDHETPTVERKTECCCAADGVSGFSCPMCKTHGPMLERVAELEAECQRLREENARLIRDLQIIDERLGQAFEAEADLARLRAEKDRA